MQGNCAQAPSATFTGGTALAPLKPRQCVVAARRSAFRVFSEKLWVDNVLTLWSEPRDDGGGVALEERPGLALWDINTPTASGKLDGRSLYLTNTTFEGPSTSRIRPMRVWQASAVMLQGEHWLTGIVCVCARSVTPGVLSAEPDALSMA